MVTPNKGEMGLYGAVVYVGTAGSIATTEVGYFRQEEAIVIAWGVDNSAPLKIQGEQYPLAHHSSGLWETVTIPATQFQVDLYAIALNTTKSSYTITTGTSSRTLFAPQISLAVVGTDADGTTVRRDYLYGSVTQEGSLSLSDPANATLPVVFRAECGGVGAANDADKPYWSFADNTATVASDVLTITKRLTLVIGESATTDDITDIAATNAYIPVGSVIRLQPYATTYAITIKDTAGITLLGTSTETCILGGQALAGWNDFQKITDATPDTWTEVGRYDPV